MQVAIPIMRKMVIEELGKAGLKVLMILYRNGGQGTVSFIHSEGVGHSSFYSAYATLLAHGLVTEKRRGNARIIILTPLGQEIAEKICELDNFFNEKISKKTK